MTTDVPAPGTGTPEPPVEVRRRAARDALDAVNRMTWPTEACRKSARLGASVALNAFDRAERAAVSAQGARADVDDLLADNEALLAQHARDTAEIEQLRAAVATERRRALLDDEGEV